MLRDVVSGTSTHTFIHLSNIRIDWPYKVIYYRDTERIERLVESQVNLNNEYNLYVSHRRNINERSFMNNFLNFLIHS